MIQNPPQDAARAACALLLGLCCFLPPVLAFPGALFVLLLLASACCLPPRPCSFFGFLCPLRCLCVFWCVVCCPFCGLLEVGLSLNSFVILTKFDINPRERRQMLGKCKLVMATGGTVSQDLTMQWSTMSGFMQDISLMVIDEGQQHRN